MKRFILAILPLAAGCGPTPLPQKPPVLTAYYETGGSPDYWKPGLKQAPLAALLALGYQPLRYRGMAHEMLPDGSAPGEVLTCSVKGTAVAVPNPTIGEP